VDRRFRCVYRLHHQGDVGGNTYLRNIGQLPTGLRGTISQKALIFILVIVRTLNLSYIKMVIDCENVFRIGIKKRLLMWRWWTFWFFANDFLTCWITQSRICRMNWLYLTQWFSCWTLAYSHKRRTTYEIQRSLFQGIIHGIHMNSKVKVKLYR
jgi:hypothetical protein